jgi:hypothetical protein
MMEDVESRTATMMEDVESRTATMMEVRGRGGRREKEDGHDEMRR